MLHYLLGEISRQEMVEKGIIATRQLAKRQFTWLRAEQGCHWLYDESELLEQALALISDQYRNCLRSQLVNEFDVLKF
jgi:tRNA dimethylallyltransferase